MHLADQTAFFASGPQITGQNLESIASRQGQTAVHGLSPWLNGAMQRQALPDPHGVDPGSLPPNLHSADLAQGDPRDRQVWML